MTIEVKNLGENNIVEVSDRVKHKGKLAIAIKGNKNILKIGSNTVLKNGLIEIRGNKCLIDIGESCLINGQLMCLNNETKLLIGSKTTMMWAKIMLHEKGTITLGKDCMLSGDIHMTVSDVHSILDQYTLERINPPGDITIGDHVWLGQGVHILKGSKIGSHSILGAKALVTGDIPNNSIAVGIPAKVVKQGITWDRELLPILQ